MLLKNTEGAEIRSTAVWPRLTSIDWWETESESRPAVGRVRFVSQSTKSHWMKWLWVIWPTGLPTTWPTSTLQISTSSWWPAVMSALRMRIFSSVWFESRLDDRSFYSSERRGEGGPHPVLHQPSVPWSLLLRLHSLWEFDSSLDCTDRRHPQRPLGERVLRRGLMLRNQGFVYVNVQFSIS